MQKIIKFNTKDQQVWFTSDWHLHHNPKWPDPIWKQRGFNSVEESDEYTINTINKLVKSTDILFNLGDLFLNTDAIGAKRTLKRINCQNILKVFGNHTSQTSKVYQEELANKFPDCAELGHEVYPLTWENLTFLGNYQEVIINGQYIVLSHFPLRIWNHMNKESWSLSGHSHFNDDGRNLKSKNDKAFDVSWDGKLAPYSFDEIKNIMKNKKLFEYDHH